MDKQKKELTKQIECPECKHSMEIVQRFREEYSDDDEYMRREVLAKCPHCDHYSRLQLSYTVSDIVFTWE